MSTVTGSNQSAQTIRPTPFQATVLSIPEDHFVFLGGGRGGGKSFALQLLILRHCDQYRARARVLVTRRRLKSLLQFAEELRGLFRAAYGSGLSYNLNDNVFRLPNGATVQLTHCESNAALQDTVQGMTFSLIAVDEAGEGPELPVIDALALTLRAPGVPLRMILAGNPGGANHSALAERYVTGREPWTPFRFADQTWVYAPSTVDDNPHLPEAYKRNFSVLAHTDPALYRAHRHGDWSAIVGDYFGGCWDRARAVFDHHEVPPDTFGSLRLSIDWGSAAPCAVVLGGKLAYDVRLSDDRVMPKGAWVIYDEHFECDPKNMSRGTGRTPGQIAPSLHEIALRNGTRAAGVIDSAAEARTAGRAEASIADLFREAGMRVSPARKGARVPRFELLKQLMANGEFFVASRCRYWLATVPALPRDSRNPEDVDSSANDHMLDATSYLIAGSAAGRVAVSGFVPMPEGSSRDRRIVLV
ncbi:phage terminase large subunit [Acidithiobacillus sp. YTS05]|nr:phage terminase large subunit [Acidithiobacillus sp. YTS05]